MITTAMQTRPDSINADLAWQAVATKDRTQDGRFFFGVRTTGVYCRPSCPARRPNRQNVAFFASPSEAQAGGFRACLRCKPDEPARDPVAMAYRAIETAETARLPLADLARLVDLSPSHLQRRFKARYGMSPRAFQAVIRDQRFKAALKQNQIGLSGWVRRGLRVEQPDL